MKHWLKENWFKLGILIILTVSLGCYLKLNKTPGPVEMPFSSEKTKFGDFKPNFVTIPLELKEKCSKLLPKFEEEVIALDGWEKDYRLSTTDVVVVYSPPRLTLALGSIEEQKG